MAILKIARMGHPVLITKAKPVKNILDPSIKKLIHNMTETMIDAKGIGLAAPQVHVSKQIIIFRILNDKVDETNEKIDVAVLINPKISNISEDQDDQWEGCLSIPGMLGLIKRYTKISYEGYDINGNLVKQKTEGLLARVIQHEYDHLNGILYTNKLVDKKAYGYEEEIEEYWKKIHEKK
tara:strand:- start:255 stop:794 length:540 start_codon:yes stop_codon:yes gene_type:complete